MKAYSDSFWGEIGTVALPVNHLFDREGNLELTGSNLSVFAHCCLLANKRHSNCEFKADIAELMTATGYSEPQVKRSLRYLRQWRIAPLQPIPRFQSPTYVISTVRGGGGLQLVGISLALDRKRAPSLRTMLRSAGEIYFSVPKCVFSRLAEFRGQALALLFVLIKHAGELKQHSFEINVQQLREMSGIAKNETLLSLLPQIESIMDVTHISGQHHARVRVLNPETGKELADEKFERELAQRSAEPAKLSPYTEGELEAWFNSEFPNAFQYGGGGELYMQCPRCKLDRPTLRFAPKTTYHWGAFYCDVCKYGRGLTPAHLVAEVKGLPQQQVEYRAKKFIEDKREREMEQ